MCLFVGGFWCVYVCVCVCCIDSTTHQIMAGPPAPSHRVINNWPFVPFLPRLFLFSPPPLLLSPSSSLHSLSPFFFSLSTCRPLFLVPVYYSLSFFFIPVFISFLRLPFFLHYVCHLSLFFSLFLSSSGHSGDPLSHFY